MIATLDAPHLLILDEPTNHLDIESREALLEALASYRGAVILVSHDMHLLSLVADRLWLVKDGRVTAYQEDLDHYRKSLLGKAEGKPKPKAEKAKKQAKPKANIPHLKREVLKCEQRLQTLHEMQEKLSVKLADPSLYEDNKKGELEVWNKKYAELMDAIGRAEHLWIEASDTLEKESRAC